jgi:heme exporter protein A
MADISHSAGRADFPQMTDSLTLAAQDLVCRRGGREVFSGLGFALSSGQALAVTGRNGAGKSSLLRMVAGLLRIEAGTLALTGGDAERSIGEQAHYLGHQDAHKPSLSVIENLEFWSAWLGGGGECAAKNRAALDAVGLDTIAALPASYLSAGQKRRLSLARLIAVPRPIWLLDEPFSALDAAARTALIFLMREHLAKGGMIIAATHADIAIDGIRELRIGIAA